jgi:hypothetical protein
MARRMPENAGLTNANDVQVGHLHLSLDWLCMDLSLQVKSELSGLIQEEQGIGL